MGVALLGAEQGGQALRQGHVVAGDVKGAHEKEDDDSQDAEEGQIELGAGAPHGEEAGDGDQDAEPDRAGGAHDRADEGEAYEKEVQEGVLHAEVEHGKGVDEDEGHVRAAGVGEKGAVGGADGGIDEIVAQSGLQRHHLHDDEEGRPEGEEAHQAVGFVGRLEEERDGRRQPDGGVGAEIVEGARAVALVQPVQQGKAGGKEEEHQEDRQAFFEGALAVFVGDEIDEGQQALVAFDGERPEADAAEAQVAGGLQHHEDEDIEEPAWTVRRHPNHQDTSRDQNYGQKRIHCLSSLSFLITLAGTPAASTPSGRLFVTTLPAATTVSRPMVTPFRTVTLAPSQT